MAKARKMIKLRVSTPDGWREIAGADIVLFEPVPVPHVVEKTADGQIRHFMGFPIEMTEEVSAIELAAAGLKV